MSEYMDLIQKEKQEALRDFNEEAFRVRLNQKLAAETRPSRSYVHWFRKPAVAGSTALLLIFLGWLSTQFFLPSFPGSEEMRIQSTFAQLFSRHGTILNQVPVQVDKGYETSEIHEFQWSIKRVIFAIQRENAPDEDIFQNVSKVLHNAAVLLKKVENNKSGEWNI